MNFQIVILMAVVACALALPVPDEEVSTIKKNPDVTTSAVDLTKSEPSLANVEDGLNTIVANVTTPKPEIESEVVKTTDAKIETSSVAEEEIQEVPKSLPVLAGVAPPAGEARAESVLAGIVPPVSEVRAEPKEAVEIAEAKSSVSSPDAEDKSDSSKPVAEVQLTTEGISTQAADENKSDAPATEDKPKSEVTESSASPKLPEAGENKTEDSSTTTADAKKGDKVDKADKSDVKLKSKEAKTDKHNHSQESNKSEDSAESKESEESEESKKN